MTVPASNTPYLLGGNAPYGRYRQADPQAYSRPIEKPDLPKLGAADRARAVKSGAIEDAGIRAGEIIGWRAWMVTDRGLLASMVACNVWKPGEPMKADVMLSTAGGVHAFKTLDQANRQYGWWAFGGSRVALGEVALWGEVIEHDGGWRAEFGAVHSIARLRGVPLRRRLQFWRQAEIDVLRQRYGLHLQS